MNKIEFENKSKIEELGRYCVYKQSGFVNAPLILGYCFVDDYWNLYKTDERGRIIIVLKTKNEDKFFNELYERVQRKKLLNGK